MCSSEEVQTKVRRHDLGNAMGNGRSGGDVNLRAFNTARGEGREFPTNERGQRVSLIRRKIEGKEGL